MNPGNQSSPQSRRERKGGAEDFRLGHYLLGHELSGLGLGAG